MSLAENLLNSLDTTSYKNMRTAGSGEEEHIIVGQDRSITVPNALKTIAVKGDKDVETATIDCVRYWDGNDLSTFAIYLNYILPNGDEGTYIPKSITKSDDFFSFDWEIGSEFTYAQGKLTFWIVTKLTDDNGELVKQWSSFQNSDCSIAQGGDKIYVPEKQTDQDVISQAISISRASAETAEKQAILAIEAANKAALDASQAAEEEVSRIIGELGVVQELGDSPNSVVSQLKVTKEFNKTNAKINRNSKRITNLEQGLPAEMFETDSTMAYQKDVPENVLPYASINKIGGMTYKTENLIPFPYYDLSRTLNGVTITVGEKGGITLDGETTADSGFSFIANANNNVDGIFTLSAATSGSVSGDNPYLQPYINGTAQAGTHLNATRSYNLKGNLNQLSMFWKKGAVFTKFVVYPMLNEGYTAKPCTPYFEGLRSAKVTAVKSVGQNLIPFPYIDTTKTAGGVTFTLNADRSITFSGDATAGNDFALGVVPIKQGESYALSIAGSASNIHYQIRFIDANGVLITTTTIESGKLNFVLTSDQIPTEAVAMSIHLKRMANGVVSGTIYPMCNHGTTSKPYTPYVEHVLPIPAAVQALDGYGLGVNENCYNYIAWNPEDNIKTWNKKCGVVDLGTLDYELRTQNNLAVAPKMIKPLSSFVYSHCPKNITRIYSNSLGDIVVEFESGAFTGVEELKAAMSGVMFVYELAEPLVTDISDLITADNLIGVEGGGTLTFENEYGYAVPSEVEYQVEV